MAAAKGSGRLRKLLKLSVFMGFIAVVAGAVAFYLFVVKIDRYRPLVAAQLEEATGLPASVDGMKLILFPSVEVTITGIRLGEGDLLLKADRIRAEVDVSSLLRRAVTVTTVEVAGLSLRVPEDNDVLAEKIDEIRTRFDEGEESGFTVNVDKVAAQNAQVFRGGGTGEWVNLSFDVTGATADEIVLALEATLPEYGSQAGFNADLSIVRGTEGRSFDSITGSGRLEGLEIAKLPIEDAPEAVLWADFKAHGESESLLGLSLEGGLDSEEAQALAGAFSGEAWWNDGTAALKGFQWDAPGVQLTADVTRYEDGRVECRLPSGRIAEEALKDLLAMAQFGDYELASQSGARVDAENLVVGLSADGEPRFDEGKLTFQGIDVVSAEGEAVTAGIQGHLQVEDGVIHVNEWRGDGFTLTGTVTPGEDYESVALDLKGRAEMTRDRLALFAPNDSIAKLEGALTFERIAGTFVQDQGVPEDLVIQGSLTGGKVGVKSEDFDVLLDPLTAEFATTKDGIDTKVRGSSKDFGDLAVSGRYTFDSFEWNGAVTGDLAHVASPFLEDIEEASQIETVLAEYGQSTFQVTLRLPSEEKKGIDIHAVRQGTPILEATVALNEDAEGAYVLGAVEARTRLSLSVLDESFPEGFTASGQAPVTLARDPKAQSFLVVADLTNCEFKHEDLLHKRSGDSLTVRVTGRATDEEWKAAKVDIKCLGVPIALEVDGERLRGRDLEISLTRLSRLLPDGGTATGRMTLSLATNPLEGTAALDRAGFALDEALRLESVSGVVEFGGEDVALRDVAVRGADSDFLLTAASNNGRWEGSLGGARFNADALLALADAANEHFYGEPESSSEDTAGGGEDLLESHFTVDLAALVYGRGQAESFRADVVTDEAGIHVTDLSFRPYTGSIQGMVDIAYAAGGPDVIDVQLAIEDADMRFLDEIAFEDPRDFMGTVSANVDFTSPMGTQEEVMQGANGTIAWSGQDGSFGKLGWATKLLAVLRATELISLRAPELRDKGLSFDTCTGRLVFNNGVATLRDGQLARRSYSMEASGMLDYPGETTDAKVNVRLLESVSNIVDKVPIIREAVGIAVNPIQIEVAVSGSPYEPNFRVAAGKSVVNVPIEALKGVKDAAKDLVKGIFKRNKD